MLKTLLPFLMNLLRLFVVIKDLLERTGVKINGLLQYILLNNFYLFSRNLLLGLACNEFTKEMTLDISNCGLGSQGAHVLESCVHGVRCISSLDISENSECFTFS